MSPIEAHKTRWDWKTILYPQCATQCATQWASQNHMKRAIVFIPVRKPKIWYSVRNQKLRSQHRTKILVSIVEYNFSKALQLGTDGKMAEIHPSLMIYCFVLSLMHADWQKIKTSSEMDRPHNFVKRRGNLCFPKKIELFNRSLMLELMNSGLEKPNEGHSKIKFV